MTEDEAKTKWCPFARLTGVTHGFFMGIFYRIYDNRTHGRLEDDPPGIRTKCIASGCMAWRGTYDFQGKRTTYIQDGSGYCGLAGRP